MLDLRDQTLELDGGRAAALANRSTGIGCDQVLVLRAADKGGDVAFEVWNADGSRAEQCGNGVRCIALYLHQRGESDQGSVALQGPAGIVHLQCREDGLVQAEMGQARFEPCQVPIGLEAEDGYYSVQLEDRSVRLSAVSMGNPHAVVTVQDLAQAPVGQLGAAIGQHPAFPEGCNVGFAQVLDRDTIALRVVERGAGETRACGSGACAAVACLQQAGLVDSPVQVIQAGGVLIIDVNQDSRDVTMTGPAAHVYEGILE